MTKEELEKEAIKCMHEIKYWLRVPIKKETEKDGISEILKLTEPREKRIADLEEKISILLSCKNCPDNKGGLLCQKEYEDKCLAQKIQYIKELKEENAELKAQIEKMKCCENCKHHYFIGDELECRLLDNGISCDDKEKWEIKEK